MQVNTSDQRNKTNPGFLLKHSTSCYPHCPHRLCKARGHCIALIWGHEIMVCCYWSVAQSCPTLTPWTAEHQASLSITNSQSLLKLMSIESVIPSNHLILPSVFPSIRVFSNESVLRIRWLKYWSFSSSISPSNEYTGLISFRMDWLDLLAGQGLSRVFSNTTVQKHQFFCAQLSL